MSISHSLIYKFFSSQILLLLASTQFHPPHLNAKASTIFNDRTSNHNRNKSKQLSPIELLTNDKTVSRNIDATFSKNGIKSDLRRAKKILDGMKSNGWNFKQEYVDFFHELLNSENWQKLSRNRYLGHCKNLLNQYLKSNDKDLARYFYHGFHLLLYPSTNKNSKNTLFSNDPPNSGDLASGFLDFIHQMYFRIESTLQISFYQLNQPQIVNDLIDLAHWIGPQRIKIILEEDYLHKDKLLGDPSDHQTALKNLLNAGIQIRTDKSYFSTGYGESHHKFAIISPDQIFSGSWNPTSRGTMRNFNHAFWLQSKKLFKLYDHEFKQIWAGNSQSMKKSHLDYRWININGGRARVFFSPQDPLKEVIISSLQKAKYKIIIGLFFLTDPDILDLLQLKRSTGVKIQIVMDNLGLGSRVAKKGESLSKILRLYQLEHWKDDGAGHWHHKAAVIDQKLILSGSSNWSGSAFTKNDENLLQIEHPKLAKKLEQVLKARESFDHWHSTSRSKYRAFFTPEYWRIIRQGNTLRIQLPSESGEWQVRINEIPVKTKISKPDFFEFVSHNFFVAKKDKLIDLYHPKFKRLHSLFLSNQDGKLSKKSSSLIKSTLIHNKFLDCLSNYPLQESCVENKFEYIGCRESRISNFTAGPWKKCDSLIRIH